MIRVFQNCAKIVPKSLITVLQDGELDKNQAMSGHAILDITIQT
jgi:hypothetical protein